MKKLLTILSLVLALSLAADALAEAPLPAAETAQTVTEEQTADEAALREALEAYKALKQEAREQKRITKLEKLKAELDGYVAEEKLTQEQADLIYNYYAAKSSKAAGPRGAKNSDPSTQKETRPQRKQDQEGFQGSGKHGGQKNPGESQGQCARQKPSGDGTDAASGATPKTNP